MGKTLETITIAGLALLLFRALKNRKSATEEAELEQLKAEETEETEEETAERVFITSVSAYFRDGVCETTRVKFSDGTDRKYNNGEMPAELDKEIQAFIDSGGELIKFTWDETKNCWI